MVLVELGWLIISPFIISQVQLLVSDSDVKSYKQIKDDLDGLRLLVEKSELWVFKAKSSEEKKAEGTEATKEGDEDDGGAEKNKSLDNSNGSKEEAESKMTADMAEDSDKKSNGLGTEVGTSKRPHPPFPLTAADKQDSAMDLNDFGPSLEQQQSRNYKTIQQILVRMNRLCVQPAFGTLTTTAGGGGSGVKPRKHEQRLLRNMGVLNVVLDLLQIPYDQKEDVRMNELMKLAHEFLQYFCLGNAQNQTLLHKHIDLFLTPGLLEAQTMCSIFQDNATLCNEVSSTEFNCAALNRCLNQLIRPGVNFAGEREGGSALCPEH